MNDQTPIETMQAEAETEQTALIVMPEPLSLEKLFRTEDGLESIIGQIEAKARAEKFDITTKEGRKAAKSLAYKIAQSKNALDKAGKDLNAEMNAAIKVVNAERTKFWDRLEALQAEVRKPVDDWEAIEDARIERHKTALGQFGSEIVSASSTVAEITDLIASMDAVEIGAAWEEFEIVAQQRRDEAIERCRAYLAVAQQREDQEAEIQRLREMQARMEAEQAAREEAARAAAQAEADRLSAEQAERDRILAEQQAETARILAEQQARMDAQAAEIEAMRKAEQDRIAAAAEAERQRIAKIAADEAEKARQAEIEAEKAAAVKRAEEQAAAQAAQEKKDAEERHAAELAAAKLREEQAAQAERDRIAAEKKAADDARAKREADEQHRAKIHADIAAALATMAGAATPEAIATALMDGKIPHTTVQM